MSFMLEGTPRMLNGGIWSSAISSLIKSNDGNFTLIKITGYSRTVRGRFEGEIMVIEIHSDDGVKIDSVDMSVNDFLQLPDYDPNNDNLRELFKKLYDGAEYARQVCAE